MRDTGSSTAEPSRISRGCFSDLTLRADSNDVDFKIDGMQMNASSSKTEAIINLFLGLDFKTTSSRSFNERFIQPKMQPYSHLLGKTWTTASVNLVGAME